MGSKLSFLQNFDKVKKNFFLLYLIVFELFFLYNSGFNFEYFFSYGNICFIFLGVVATVISKNLKIVRSKFWLFIFYVFVFLTFFNPLVEHSLFFLQKVLEYRISYFQLLCFFIFSLFLLVISLNILRLNKLLHNYFQIAISYYCILFVFNYLTLIYPSNEIEEKLTQSDSKKDSMMMTKDKKSIILIVLDEYSPDSEIVYSKMFNSISPLEKYLTNNNFQVKTIKTFEASTYRSINRIFNSKFEDDFERPDIQHIKKQLFNTKFINELNEQGYSFINLSFFDFINHSSFYNKDPYVSQNSYSVILKFSIFKLFYDRLFENKYENFNYNKSILQESMYQFQQENNSLNKFYYLHVLMPHGPFFYGDEFDYKTRTLENYLLYRKFTCDKLIDLLKKIELDKYQIIIISDHGYRSTRYINPYNVLFASYGFQNEVESIMSLDQIHTIILK